MKRKYTQIGWQNIIGKAFILTAIVIALGFAVRGQTPLPANEPKVCISQPAANKCAENARLVPALEAKIAELEAALKTKDASIDELTETNRRNVADLTASLNKTQIELATKTGQLIGAEAEKTRLLALIDVLLKSAKPKQNGLINIKL